ncbi:hypothetical protein MOQ07_11295 [Stenotrophomonas maltophilia]|nr:hypothetical protein [Stenotrophomonas maltophilia]MCI1087226.1 hypothetical protein [Stenotrophomonas maltophilia]MCI1115126.1 hypothetical protein [Stenotrophomonas maltophilia]
MNSYANVGCASVLLGGAGLVFIGGGLEMLQNGSSFGWLAVLGGIGTWLVLAFLFWITHRANRRRAWINRQPFPHHAEQGLPRGGFWRGFLWTWAAVIALHTLVFLVSSFAQVFPRPEHGRGLLAVAGLALIPAHAVIPILAGMACNLMRETSLR